MGLTQSQPGLWDAPLPNLIPETQKAGVVLSDGSPLDHPLDEETEETALEIWVRVPAALSLGGPLPSRQEYLYDWSKIFKSPEEAAAWFETFPGHFDELVDLAHFLGDEGFEKNVW
jgi:hypothetical protein